VAAVAMPVSMTKQLKILTQNLLHSSNMELYGMSSTMNGEVTEDMYDEE